MDPLAHLNAALSHRYEVGRELGSGGMATVYLPRDLPSPGSRVVGAASGSIVEGRGLEQPGRPA